MDTTAGTLTVSGGIGESSSRSGSLTKTGSGLLLLSAASTSTYTGPTTVSEGELQVDGINTGSAVTLQPDSPLGTTLSGTGSVGTVTSIGGIIAPGDDAVGTLTVAGLTLDSATSVNVDVASATSYDQIVSTGSISLGGAILAPTFGGTTASSDRLVILKNNLDDQVEGNFSQATTPPTTLSENSLVTVGPDNYRISYAYADSGTNNNVVLKGLTATTTTFTAAPTSPVIYGDTLTYTVHVSAGAVTPAAGAAIQLWADKGSIPLQTSTIDASGNATFTYSGFAAGNHNVTVMYLGDGVFAPSQAAQPTLTVNKKALTVTGITASKVYDGNTGATFDTSAMAPGPESLSGDTVTVSLTGTPTGVYPSKNVGTYQINGTGLTIDNTNYTLAPLVVTASITPKTLTASIVGIGTPAVFPTKVYDGTTKATLAPGNYQLSGLVHGESITVTSCRGDV